MELDSKKKQNATKNIALIVVKDLRQTRGPTTETNSFYETQKAEEISRNHQEYL